jgi:hypothetical protein
VPNPDLPRDLELEEATVMLDQGLKSCRTVISSYRALLMPEQSNDNSPADIGDTNPQSAATSAE